MPQPNTSEPEHTLPPAEAPATDPQKGLSAQEAAARLARLGPNRLPEKKPKSPLLIFLSQFKDVMIIILIVAIVAAFVVAALQGVEKNWDFSDRELVVDFVQPFIILAVVLTNCGLGTWQEVRSAKSVKALRAMGARRAKVRRDGQLLEINADELVVGDVILMEAGDYVPADAKLLSAANFRVVESALTGESLPVEKDASAQVPQNAPLGDRKDRAFSSCAVIAGTATAVVTATGAATEIGKIAGLIDATEAEPTPLQLKLGKLSRAFGWAAAVLFVVVFAVQVGMMALTNAGAVQRDTWTSALIVAISLAVAAIPEGLGAFTTIILSLGIHNMTKESALIKKLTAVETLGSTSVICTDKTGTLTQNKITVQSAYTPEDGVSDGQYSSPSQLALIKAAMLCTEGSIQVVDGVESGVGDPTETALLFLGKKLGLGREELFARCPRVRTVPFDSDRKLMTVVNVVDGKYVATVKGAPEMVVARCAGADAEAVAQVTGAYSDKAYRTLAVAVRELTQEQAKSLSDAELESGLRLIGVFAMIDPPREEAKLAVADCWHAGIKTVMITGDHLKTAVAIARQIDIYRDGDLAIDGDGLLKLSDADLAKDIARYSVFARVSPSDKLRIVKAWRANDQVVAMTGDGVNDAPALRAADIGCAMGITGTEVSKEAADMVLMDDNFATIAKSVSSGRRIYERIRNVVQNLLISSIAEIVVVFLGSLIFANVHFGPADQAYTLPANFAVLSAGQLLWINLLVHGVPGVALGMQASESRVMGSRPFSKHESIFARGMGLNLFWQGMLISFLALLAYALAATYAANHAAEIYSRSPALYGQSGADAAYGVIISTFGSTAAFLCIGVGAAFHAVNLMSEKSIFRCSVRFYRLVYASAVFSILMILLVAFVPPLAEVFNMAQTWYAFPDAVGYGIGLSFFLTAACEAVKLAKLLWRRTGDHAPTINDFVMIARPKPLFRGKKAAKAA